MNAEFTFPALKGMQAGKPYYTVMLPLKLVPRILIFQEEELPAELRSQRVINRVRVPEIAQYIIDNQENYTFSSLTVSIDSDISFKQLHFQEKEVENVGLLKVPMDAKFLINDGQHRRAAIEEALRTCPDLGEETISVVFFIDTGLKRSQQMFADLNKHAVRPTRSIGILYDHRDPMSKLARTVVDRVDVFRNLTEVEKTSISNRSNKLFTLSAIYEGTLALLRKNRKSKQVTPREIDAAVNFWNEVCSNMGHWRLAAKKEISPCELRKEYIHAHGLTIQALGKLGSMLLADRSKDLAQELKKLEVIDWSRKNTAIWQGRAMISGRISKSHTCVILTANYLKKMFGCILTPEEAEIEQQYLEMV